MPASHERYPVQQAQQVIEECISGGSCVLGFEGRWVNGYEIRPDLDYVAEFSPDGPWGLGPSRRCSRSGRGTRRSA